MDEINPKLGEFINTIDFESKSDFDWFDNNLDRLLYTLRHSEWHLGEIYGLLKEYVGVFKWK